MESSQGEVKETKQPCALTPKTETLLLVKSTESEMESDQDRITEAVRPCVTPKTETLLHLQRSQSHQEGITKAGQPFDPPKTHLGNANNSDDQYSEPAIEVPLPGGRVMPGEGENRPAPTIKDDENRDEKYIKREEVTVVAITKEEDEDENGEPEQAPLLEAGFEPEEAKLLPEPARENETHSRSKAEDDERRCKIFVIGKTGTGKSSLCNTIVGRQVFPTGRSFKQVTTETREEATEHSGLKLTVVDTPDISESEKSSRQNTVGEWKQSARGHSHMVVLAVRCDQRYSPAEYEVYRQIRELWGRDLCRRLVVAFTFADTRDDSSVGMTEELKEVWPELKLVMKDAGGRYVLFDNKSGKTDREAVETLTDIMEQLNKEGGWWEWISRPISVVMLGGFFFFIWGYLICKAVIKGPRRLIVNLYEMLRRPMLWWH